MIPAHYPTAWKQALATGDASDFKTEAELISFFHKTAIGKLNQAEESHYFALADRYEEIWTEAMARQQAESRAEYDKKDAARQPAFLASIPMRNAKPVVDKPAASSWAAAIARVNKQNGFGR